MGDTEVINLMPSRLLPWVNLFRISSTITYAIGYASFGVANQNAGKVVTMKVNGVEPTKENIINGSYIIQRPLLLVGSGEPTAIQQAFLDVSSWRRQVRKL